MDLNKIIEKTILEYINENDVEYTNLIHVTTPEIADKIKKEGFKPKPFINYKYYSSLGKNGIYFYDNLRQAQYYAGFFMSKLKINKVALIFAHIPKNVLIKNDKIEDGYFVDDKYLDKIIIERIKLSDYSNIY